MNFIAKLLHKIGFQKPAVKGECKTPPAGWHCTREEGHEGPCAAWPTILPCPVCNAQATLLEHGIYCDSCLYEVHREAGQSHEDLIQTWNSRSN